jgi:hypothetical protein
MIFETKPPTAGPTPKAFANLSHGWSNAEGFANSSDGWSNAEGVR